MALRNYDATWGKEDRRLGQPSQWRTAEGWHARLEQGTWLVERSVEGMRNAFVRVATDGRVIEVCKVLFPD